MYIQFSKSIHIPSFRMNPYRGYKIHLAGCHKLDKSTNAVAFPLKKSAGTGCPPEAPHVNWLSPDILYK